MKKALRGNFLPSPTFRWLNVNDVEIDLKLEKKLPYKALQNEGVLDESLKSELLSSDHGISDEVLVLNQEQCNLANHYILEDKSEIYLKMPLSRENPLLVDQQQISVPALHKGTVVFYNYAEDNSYAERNGMIFLDVENDAELNLVIVQHLNAASSSNVAVLGRVGDGARLNVATVELGAGRSVFHYMCKLEGFAAESSVQTAYLGSEDNHLDLFYHTQHIGEESISDLRVNGALMDQAIKKFRGTIDFVKGCSGSDGNEEEFCVLLDHTVHSIAVPLLLAGEDDIVGNHAASAGKIDEDQLFYLMSRGLERKEAEGLIVESKMASTFDQIPDKALKDSLKHEIHERILKR